MKKFHTQYDKYNKDESSRNIQRQKTRIDDGRRFPKYSNKYMSEHFASLAFEEDSINQLDRRTKIFSEEPISLNEQITDTHKEDINFIDEFPLLNDVDINTELPDTRKNHTKTTCNDSPPFNQNICDAHFQPKKQRNKNDVPKSSYAAKNKFQGSRNKDVFANSDNIENECSDNKKSNNRMMFNKKNSSSNPDLRSGYLKNMLYKFQDSNRKTHAPDKSYEHYHRQIIKYGLPSTHSNDLSKNSKVVEDQKTNFQNGCSKDDCYPKTVQSVPYEDMAFSSFKLTDLLFYNASLMQDQQLFDYAFAVKCKILARIHEIQHPEKDELEFLCELTDGSQTEKNQRLITTRTCLIVHKIIDQLYQILDEADIPYSSQALDLKAVSNSHIANDCYNSDGTQIAQNSDVSLTSNSDVSLTHDTEFNRQPECSIVQNDKNATSNEAIHYDSKFANENGKKYETNSFVAINTKNIYAIDLPENNHRESKEISEKVSEDYSTPVINSEENILINNFSFKEEDSIFAIFGLDNLLKYDIDAMHGYTVTDYAFSMKLRILESIHRFLNPFREKLEFLCEITDGTQSEQNQKLINIRMCALIIEAYETGYTLKNNSKFSSGHTRNAVKGRSHYSDTRRNK